MSLAATLLPVSSTTYNWLVTTLPHYVENQNLHNHLHVFVLRYFPEQCGNWFRPFQCNNGRCIDGKMKCTRRDFCGDNSDNVEGCRLPGELKVSSLPIKGARDLRSFK